RADPGRARVVAPHRGAAFPRTDPAEGVNRMPFTNIIKLRAFEYSSRKDAKTQRKSGDRRSSLPFLCASAPWRETHLVTALILSMASFATAQEKTDLPA